MRIELQYWNGVQWTPCNHWLSERSAWQSLGGDDRDYRTVDSKGNVLTDKRRYPSEPKEQRGERNEHFAEKGECKP